MTVEIPLTRGYVALVDDADAELVSQYRWHPKLDRNITYAQSTTRVTEAPKTTIRMHRLILGATPGVEVDHINHDGLDNRRSNLRLCTRSQNMRNIRLIQVSTSGIKGVYWNKQHQKWRAQIMVEGKKIYLGSFASAEEAGDAYRAAAEQHFGDFAHVPTRGAE